MLSQLINYSPIRVPLLWIVLNAICCLLVGYVLLDALIQGCDVEEVKESYLVYNFVICVIWVAEAGLYVLEEKERGWQTWVEFVAALYFVVDCGVAVLQWHLQHIKSWEIYFDSGLDFVFYIYYLVQATRTWYKQRAQALPNPEEGEAIGGEYVRDDDLRPNNESEIV